MGFTIIVPCGLNLSQAGLRHSVGSNSILGIDMTDYDHYVPEDKRGWLPDKVMECAICHRMVEHRHDGDCPPLPDGVVLRLWTSLCHEATRTEKVR